MYVVKEKDGEKSRECDSRSEAEEIKADMEGLGVDVEIVAQDEPTEEPPEDETEAEVVDEKIVTPDEAEESLKAIDELGQELGTDPLNILPKHMVDDIQGKTAVNKRGYAMIAERYGIAVSAEILHYPWDNDEGRAVCRAVATTDDGREYSGVGTAAESDGDMPEQLLELAETRSLKRAVSWASGVGIVSYQELMGQLE